MKLLPTSVSPPDGDRFPQALLDHPAAFANVCAFRAASMEGAGRADLFGPSRAPVPPDPPPAPFPRRVMQYWDRDVPADVERILTHNRALCAGSGHEHTLFDDDRARAFLAERLGPECVDHYAACPHPAMKCDLFRLAYLYREGGFYIDADNVLRRGLPARVSVTAGFFQRTIRDEPVNVLNDFMFAVPGDPVVGFLLHVALNNLRRARSEGADLADPRRILFLTGPVMFTRAIGTLLADPAAEPWTRTMSILAWANRNAFIRNAAAFLGRPPDYKSDDRHWARAAGMTRPATP